MTWPAPLPLAPRPLPGEAVLSWVRRVAARYDLDAPGLIAAAGPPGVAVHRSRIGWLDWGGDASLDVLLAAATRLDAGRIAALRPVAGGPERAGLLHRVRPAWCESCIRDDVARHGEAYERAVWRLGWCVACPVHGCLLGEACSSCLLGYCHFGSVAGRQRLVCGTCHGPVDALPPSRLWPFRANLGPGHAEWPRPKVDASVLALQAALLAAAMDTAPAGPLGFGLDADLLLAVVHGLTMPLACPLASEQAVAAALIQDLRMPGALAVVEAHRLLGDVAAVLGSVAGAALPSPGVPSPLGEGTTGASLASVLGRFLPWDRALLRRRATAWGPILAPAVLGTLDTVEGRMQRVVAEAERLHQEVARARTAAKRAAADLRQIWAKKIRRAALRRLGQKQRKVGCTM